MSSLVDVRELKGIIDKIRGENFSDFLGSCLGLTFEENYDILTTNRSLTPDTKRSLVHEWRDLNHDNTPRKFLENVKRFATDYPRTIPGRKISDMEGYLERANPELRMLRDFPDGCLQIFALEYLNISKRRLFIWLTSCRPVFYEEKVELLLKWMTKHGTSSPTADSLAHLKALAQNFSEGNQPPDLRTHPHF